MIFASHVFVAGLDPDPAAVLGPVGLAAPADPGNAPESRLTMILI